MARRTGNGRAAQADPHAVGFLGHLIRGGIEFARKPVRLRSRSDPQRAGTRELRRAARAGARPADGGIADGKRVAGAQGTAAHPSHDVDGGGAHGFGHADAAAHGQVSARAGTSGAATHGVAGLDLEGGPERQAGAEI